MPGGPTKFNEKWLEATDNNGDLVSTWCRQGRCENEAFCMLCKSFFMISNSGISQLTQHSSTDKHKNASRKIKGQMKLSLSGNVNRIDRSSAPGGSDVFQVSNDQMVTRAEAIWAMKVVASNFSFALCKDIVPLFQVMFEGHPAVKQMQIGVRKVSYVISHGLGPYFQNEIINELKTSQNWFTIAFDETTTSQIKKQLDLYIRFWSEKKQKIINGYINSVFLGHAEAVKICKSIVETLNDLKLPLNKILMLSMDGPNVNLSVAKKINEELAIDNSPELIDFGTCSLHKIHNSFSKALSSLSLDVDQFSNDLFSFFKLSAARREDLKDIQKLLDCEENFLLRHISSRWLTLGSVINRIIDVHPSLDEYFIKFLPKQKSGFNLISKNPRNQRIVKTLKDQSTLVYLEFLAYLCPVLESYLALFQKEGPLVHILYNKMNELLRNVMLKYLKETSVGMLEGKDLIGIDIEDSKNFRPIKDLDIGVGARKAISKLKENERTSLRTEFRKCLISLTKHLKETLPVTNNFLKDLEILHPLMRKNSTDNAVMRLCVNMKPLKLNNQAINAIVREWQVYRLDKDVEELCVKFTTDVESDDVVLQYERIDLYWAQILSFTEKLTGVPKYERLATLIKSALSLSHGNADVERGFSVNNAIVSSERTSLSEKAIIGLRLVKDTIQRYEGILNIPITGKLLNSVTKAHSVYKEDKRKEEEAQKEQAAKRAQHESEQLKKKLRVETKEKLSEMEKDIKSLKDDLNTAQTLLNEGNERLQKAMKMKDFKEMSVASAMIESGTSKVKILTDKLTEAENKKSKPNSET